MLLVVSPAKSLNMAPAAATVPHSQPKFIGPAAQLVKILKGYAPQDLAALMGISDKLAMLNVARYQAWQSRFSLENAKQAMLAFDGDVYDGLQATSLTPAQWQWAQQHLRILSGLYGVLRPLDLMQPYRLEMSTRLPQVEGGSLYGFWGWRIAADLNQALAGNAQPVLVNLASQEYFKSIDRGTLKAQVLNCVFQDEKNGLYKTIGLYAKRARGLMARYAIENRITQADALRGFDAEGYAWAKSASSAGQWVFRRKARP